MDIIWGVGFDETLGDGVKMTILAAGFDITLQEEEDELVAEGGGMKGGFRFPGAKIGGAAAAPASNQNPAAAVAQPTVQNPVEAAPVAKPKSKEVFTDTRIEEEYGTKAKVLTEAKDRSSIIILGIDQLDDDAICDILEKYPTYKRDRKIVESVRSGFVGYPSQHTVSNNGGGGHNGGMTITL